MTDIGFHSDRLDPCRHQTDKARRTPVKETSELSLRSFLKCLLSVLFVVGVMADVTPVSSQSRLDAPRIEDFTFTPSTFKHGDRVKLSFVYRDVRGGLAGSEVLLYYEGSLFEHTRKPSGFTRKIMRKNKGNDLESGVVLVTVRFRPGDDPPFDIKYSIRIIDAEGRKSNWAETTVKYEAD